MPARFAGCSPSACKPAGAAWMQAPAPDRLPAAGLPPSSKQLCIHGISLRRARLFSTTAAFDPAEFFTWNAAASGERMGVDAAVLLDVFTLIPDHVPSWAVSRSRSCRP